MTHSIRANLPVPLALRRKLSHLGVIPRHARWQPLHGGRTSRVFRVTGAFSATSSTPDGIVCKLTRLSKSSPLFPVDPRAEAYIMSRLAPRFSTAALKMIRHGPDACLLYPFTKEDGPGLSAEDLGAVLGALHATRLAGLPLLPSPPLVRKSLLAAGLSYLHQSGWTKGRLGQIETVAKISGSRRLLHGDPVRANALSTRHGPRMIDWQCASLGDPCFDLSIALSPAMHQVYGDTDQPIDYTKFLLAYGHASIVRRYWQVAPALHAQIIGHCLWRIQRGDADYRPALEAETSVLAQMV